MDTNDTINATGEVESQVSQTEEAINENAQPDQPSNESDQKATPAPVIEEQTSEDQPANNQEQSQPTESAGSTEEEDTNSRILERKSTSNVALSKQFLKKREPEPERNVEELWRSEDALSLDQRRARYSNQDFITIDNILSWSNQTAEPSSDLPKHEFNDEINRKVSHYHGNIVKLEIDAVVNAANETLLGGGGIDGAIHRAAGPLLYEECRTLHGCSTGNTKITRGYNLPAKYILHTVGPVGEQPDLLISCYKTCLDLVIKHNIKTVAFCGISTGIFGYPVENASQVALSTIREWLENKENRDKVDRIIFVTFNEKERDCYAKSMPIYFPQTTPAAEEVKAVPEPAPEVEQKELEPTPETPKQESKVRIKDLTETETTTPVKASTSQEVRTTEPTPESPPRQRKERVPRDPKQKREYVQKKFLEQQTQRRTLEAEQRQKQLKERAAKEQERKKLGYQQVKLQPKYPSIPLEPLPTPPSEQKQPQQNKQAVEKKENTQWIYAVGGLSIGAIILTLMTLLKKQ